MNAFSLIVLVASSHALAAEEPVVWQHEEPLRKAVVGSAYRHACVIDRLTVRCTQEIPHTFETPFQLYSASRTQCVRDRRGLWCWRFPNGELFHYPHLSHTRDFLLTEEEHCALETAASVVCQSHPWINKQPLIRRFTFEGKSVAGFAFATGKDYYCAILRDLAGKTEAFCHGQIHGASEETVHLESSRGNLPGEKWQWQHQLIGIKPDEEIACAVSRSPEGSQHLICEDLARQIELPLRAGADPVAVNGTRYYAALPESEERYKEIYFPRVNHGALVDPVRTERACLRTSTTAQCATFEKRDCLSRWPGDFACPIRMATKTSYELTYHNPALSNPALSTSMAAEPLVVDEGEFDFSTEGMSLTLLSKVAPAVYHEKRVILEKAAHLARAIESAGAADKSGIRSDLHFLLNAIREVVLAVQWEVDPDGDMPVYAYFQAEYLRQLEHQNYFHGILGLGSFPPNANRNRMACELILTALDGVFKKLSAGAERHALEGLIVELSKHALPEFEIDAKRIAEILESPDHQKTLQGLADLEEFRGIVVFVEVIREFLASE